MILPRTINILICLYLEVLFFHRGLHKGENPENSLSGFSML